MSGFHFGGLDVGRYCLARIERPVGPAARVTTEQVPGRDGEVLVSVEREAMRFVAHLTLRPRLRFDWPDVRTALAAAFSASEARRLALPDEDGWWRWAVASFDDTAVETPLDGPVTFDVTFTCPEPFAHGAVRRATVPSGGTAVVLVGGTLPTPLSVSAASAVRDGSCGLWGIRVDEGKFMRVSVPVAAASSISVDGGTGVVRVNGAVSMMTIDSDWVELSPGAHTVRMDLGTGAATVEWEERWL